MRPFSSALLGAALTVFSLSSLAAACPARAQDSMPGMEHDKPGDKPGDMSGDMSGMAWDGRHARHARHEDDAGLSRPLRNDPGVLRYLLAAGVDAPPRLPLHRRPLADDAPRGGDDRLRPPGREARRRRRLELQHADDDGQPPGRSRPAGGAGDALGRALDDRRQGLPASPPDRRDGRRGAPSRSTGSIRTTSSWRSPAPTACRSRGRTRSSSTPASPASRPSGPPPSRTGSRRWTTRRRRSPTTGSTRPTSASG